MQTFSKERRAICGICPAGCWIIASYDERGRLSAVRPDEDTPWGVLCKLGEHSAEIVYSPNRLKAPLRRKGPKGTMEFEAISWDEAFNQIVSRLKAIKAESGPESAAIYTGRGSFELAMCDVFQPAGVAVSSASSVLFPFGSPNTMGVGALCYVSYAMIAPHVTMGGMLIQMFSDLENAELIVVWGANPATDSPPVDFYRINEAVKRGARVVVIDPRRTAVAKLPGAEWIAVRPGTDGALALGLCAILIEEELYDDGFVRNWTRGFEDFAAYVQHFRPEVVESITGVPQDMVRSLARRLAAARGAAPVMYTGLEYNDSGVQAIRATMVLWALAGQLDVPGGRCFAMPGSEFPINRDGLIPNPNMNKALGVDSFPVYSAYRGESHANALPDAVLNGRPYPMRSLIVLGASMITSWPQPNVWRRTLAGLDQLVCIDVNLTADCAYADIVLPAATWYEIESYMRYGPVFRIRERVIEPVGQSRNAFFIMTELAQRLGYGHLYPRDEDQLLRHALKKSPYTLEQVRDAGGTVRIQTDMMQYKKWEKGLLRSDGRPGFDTPSGKFEIASTILEEHGYSPLPVYTEPAEGPLAQPELARDYPLVFNSGARVTTDFRSQFHGIEGLSRQRPEPTVTIHTGDAAARGIKDGDKVRLQTPRGQVRMRARVTDDMVPGAIDANMGGGGPLGPKAWRECNINELTDLRYDPISGFPIYKSLLCQVEKAGQDTALQIDSGETTYAVAGPPVRTAAAPGERIYLDHNATTAPDPEVFRCMADYLQNGYGNPSSIYREGRGAKTAIEDARRKVAKLLGCTARRISFTGGGSEANNWVIKAAAFDLRDKKPHFITSCVEHPSVLKTMAWLRQSGFTITLLPVDRYGQVDPDDLAEAITPQTGLVSIMAANNETGTIQPIAQLARIAREREVLFHTDAVQAAGKIILDAVTLGIDFLSMSAHKLHGPKGVGALYMRQGVKLTPLIHGGGQEHGLRAGTENSLGIVGFGRAAELAGNRLEESGARIGRLRDRLQSRLLEIVPDARVNGHPTDRLPNTLNVSLPSIRGESMVLALDLKGVCISSGSACRSGSPDPSHALLAMGLTDEQAHCALRFSLGHANNRKQVDRVAALIDEIIHHSMNNLRFVACR